MLVIKKWQWALLITLDLALVITAFVWLGNTPHHNQTVQQIKNSAPPKFWGAAVLFALFLVALRAYEIHVLRRRRPRWAKDPYTRHELRYWDGAAWTEHVSDGDVQATDAQGSVTHDAAREQRATGSASDPTVQCAECGLTQARSHSVRHDGRFYCGRCYREKEPGWH